MARDRQRSKARRKRRGGAGKPAGSRARDIGLDDASIEESGLADAAPAPDPLKNVSPDVDQARAAETGARRGPPGEEIDLGADDIFASEDDLARAPDELETPADLVASRRRRGGAAEAPEEAEVPAGRPTAKERGRVIAFLLACVDELRRVQWPDRRHVFQATAVVLGFVLVAGAWLGLMDAIWQPLINAIL